MRFTAIFSALAAMMAVTTATPTPAEPTACEKGEYRCMSHEISAGAVPGLQRIEKCDGAKWETMETCDFGMNCVIGGEGASCA
ncbi:hypothetical protein MauCBS54593_005871 [Microsporum audouinii]